MIKKGMVVLGFLVLICICFLLYHEAAEVKYLLGEKISYNLNLQQITLGQMETALDSQDIDALLFQSDVLTFLNASSQSSKNDERRLLWSREYEKLAGVISIIAVSVETDEQKKTNEIVKAHTIIDNLQRINNLAIETCSRKELSTKEQMEAYYELLIPGSKTNRKLEAALEKD